MAKEQQEHEEVEEVILKEATEEELKKPKSNAILVESKAIILGNVFQRMKKGQNY